ncbi:MAG: type II toxin-antitoxin system VapC family toxin [Planctomycetia bacterium]|nr:type II toxin-antitoxin system VapC family toxin [Planctomycetia bacterium]
MKVTDGIQEEALRLFRKIEHKELSFVDCTSFHLMKKEGIARALTFDAHFAQMGFLKEP